MKQSLQNLAVAVPLLLAAQSSQAEVSPFSIGLDTSFTTSYSSPPLNDNFAVTKETTTIVGLRTYLSYNFTDNISVELGLTHRNNYHQEATSTFASYQADIKASNKDITLAYHFTDTLPGLFFLTGLTWTKYDLTAKAKIFNHDTDMIGEYNHRNYTLGIGYERPFNDNWHWRVAYTRYGQDTIAIFGLRYRFGAH